MPLSPAAGATASVAGSTTTAWPAAATSEPPVQELLPKTTRTVQTTSATSMYLLALASQPTGLPWKVLPGASSHQGRSVSKVSSTMAEKSPALTKPSLLQSPRALLAITRTLPSSVLTGKASSLRLAAMKASGTLV